MDIRIVAGSNHRNYIQIEKLESLQELKDVEKIVYRSEYKPYIKSFNKNISYSYLINDTFIPLQFLSDIQNNFPHKINIINKDELSKFYNTDISRTLFDALIKEIKLPPKYNIYAEAYSYQPNSVFKALITKTGRIKIGTGGGKTLITYLYCKYLLRHLRGDRKARKIMIIVPKVDLVKQTVKAFNEFNKFNETLNVQSVYSGAKKVADAEVIVGTYQSLCNYEPEYFDDFFCMIGDEAHTTKAYSIREEIYNKCKNIEYLFGMTATYPDYNTLDYLNIVAMFGPLIHEKSLRQLIDDGNICDIEINRVLIEYSDPAIKNITKKLKAENELLEVHDKLTGSEIYRAERAQVQKIPKRNKLIEKLSSLEGNHLILVENVEYLEHLYSEMYLNFTDKQVIFIHGGVKNRDELFELMENNSNVICIATYDTFSTGISVNNIHHIHFPDGGKSMFRVLQGIGRGVRLHISKKLVKVFDYVDKIIGSSYGKHANERLKIYKKEKLTVKEFKVKL